jgi:hypothetical protein
MAPPGTDSGPPINGHPPEQPLAPTDHVANRSAENRQSRERLMSSKVNEDGGEAGGVSSLSSSRKNSLERKKEIVKKKKQTRPCRAVELPKSVRIYTSSRFGSTKKTRTNASQKWL